MSSPDTKIQIPTSVHTPVRAVVELFRGPLKSVVFPNVDGGTLDELVDEVRGRLTEVAAARISLEGAERGLDDAQNELRKVAQRAHAYALIFAAGDEALSVELEAIDMQPKPERRKRKMEPKAPRKRRTKTTGLELPLEAEAETEVEAEVEAEPSTETELHS